MRIWSDVIGQCMVTCGVSLYLCSRFFPVQRPWDYAGMITLNSAINTVAFLALAHTKYSPSHGLGSLAYMTVSFLSPLLCQQIGRRWGIQTPRYIEMVGYTVLTARINTSIMNLKGVSWNFLRPQQVIR